MFKKVLIVKFSVVKFNNFSRYWFCDWTLHKFTYFFV